jgi:hypothetical protein
VADQRVITEMGEEIFVSYGNYTTDVLLAECECLNLEERKFLQWLKKVEVNRRFRSQTKQMGCYILGRYNFE